MLFVDELKVLVYMIIANIPSFQLEANMALKQQYTHYLWNPYYVAIARCQLMGSPETETFTEFHGQLVLTFWGHNKCYVISTLTSKVDAPILEVMMMEISKRVASQEILTTIKTR